MSNFGLCCSPVGEGSSAVSATIQNVGGGTEVYVNGTSNPFDLRTLTSTNGSITLTQTATTVNLSETAAANIGAGVDVYQAGSLAPRNFRRLEVIDDGTNIHGSGNLAFWQDSATNTLKIDLPKSSFQSTASITINNVLTTLVDVTFGNDSAGANVAGIDGETWMCWWSLKVCGDPSFPQVDAVSRLRSHNGVGWTVLDTVHTRWTVGLTPSSPICRPFRLDNTNWSGNGGLRLSIECATANFSVFNEFEHPSIYIQRHNK